MKADDDF